MRPYAGFSLKREPVLRRLFILQTARRRRGPRLELRYPRFIFRGEIQKPFFGEGVGLSGESAAAFGLVSQGCYIHHSPTGRVYRCFDNTFALQWFPSGFGT